jgi:hypothetical protein
MSVSCELCVLYRQSLLHQADCLSSGVLPSAVCLKQRLHESNLHTTCQRVHSLASVQAAHKLAISIICRSEKVAQSACSALVHHSKS